jgi:hypothetical protein
MGSQRRRRSRFPMSKIKIGYRAALVSLVLWRAMPAATATGDLSKYRGFQFGTDLAAVARQAEVSDSQAKVIHRRPALMQELEWRPQGLGTAHPDEPANDVVFSFYNGQLYRVAVTYDRFKVEGMTTEDIVEAVSTMYGPAGLLAAPVKLGTDPYNQDEVVARWQDSQYSFELIRSSYGPGFRLVGVIKRLDALAQAAVATAKLLDDQEAPEREAARAAAEAAAAKVKLEKARLANKARFRP